MKPKTMYCGGYYETGKVLQPVFLKPRNLEVEAEQDARYTGQPREWLFVAEIQVLAVELMQQ